MTDITIAMLQELRERTGVGMSKCKDALVRAGGSIDKAIEILRKEGMASAVKKEGRETKEGFIGFSETDDALSLIEISCETDFVAQNNKFTVFLSDLAAQAATDKPSSLEEFMSQKFLADQSLTVEQYKNILIQQFGENIQVKRLEIIEKKENCSYGIYSHMGGKIVTVIEIQGSKEAKVIAKEVAMHVAAEAPEYLKEEDVPQNIVEKEKEIMRSQIKNKPENMIERIVEGKMKSFYDRVCLLSQKYVKDASLSVKQFVETASLKNGQILSVSRFWYWKIGQ